MRPFSSPAGTPQPNPSAASPTEDDAAARPPPPHAPTLPSRRLPTLPSSLSLSLSATRPLMAASTSFLSSVSSSLAGLSLSHEEARLARLANRRRDRPASSLSVGGSHTAALPASSAQSLAHSDRLLEESYSRLSLSPPSPTPSLMSGASSVFARSAHQRRLWPPQADDDEEEEAVSRASRPVRVPSVPSAAAHPQEGNGSGNGGNGGNGRQVSERQRQHMQYTESLSPSPLEEPHDEPDKRAASTAPVGAVSSAADGNPLSAAILYVYSLVTTSPADVAGLRPRDFILSIGSFSKQGWQPDMIEVSPST